MVFYCPLCGSVPAGTKTQVHNHLMYEHYEQYTTATRDLEQMYREIYDHFGVIFDCTHCKQYYRATEENHLLHYAFRACKNPNAEPKYQTLVGLFPELREIARQQRENERQKKYYTEADYDVMMGYDGEDDYAEDEYADVWADIGMDDSEWSVGDSEDYYDEDCSVFEACLREVERINKKLDDELRAEIQDELLEEEDMEEIRQYSLSDGVRWWAF